MCQSDKYSTYRTAIHEAAHAFMYIHLGHTFNFVDIIPNDSGSRFGRISDGRPTVCHRDTINLVEKSLEPEEDNQLETTIENLIFIYLAGYESEKVFNVYDPSLDNEIESDDFTNASALVDILATRNGLVDRMKLIGQYRTKTQRIIEKNRLVIERIANKLVESVKISFKEVYEITSE